MAIRAREIRLQLEGQDINPKLMKILEAMAEELRAQDKSIAECMTLITMTVEQHEKFNMVAEGMRKRLEEMKRNKDDPNPDLGVSTDDGKSN